jgi:tetratricopeptide (TPR) repeat protein
MFEDRRRKAEAGARFFGACERLVGADGPAQLGREVGFSASFWSRLRSGSGAGLPKWERFRAGLKPHLPDSVVQELKREHAAAWLIERDQQWWETATLTFPVSLDHLRETLRIAHVIGYERYENHEALILVQILESILTRVPEEELSAEALELLTACLENASVYQANLRNYAAARAAAERAARLQHHVGTEGRELHCRHSIALVYYRERKYHLAISAFTELDRRYGALDLKTERIRCLRDLGATKAHLGAFQVEAYTEGEQLLRKALVLAEGLPPDFRYPTLLWLADLEMKRMRLKESRAWLGRLDDLANRHPKELDGMIRMFYMIDHRDQLEQHLARREIRARKRR